MDLEALAALVAEVALALTLDSLATAALAGLEALVEVLVAAVADMLVILSFFYAGDSAIRTR